MKKITNKTLLSLLVLVLCVTSLVGVTYSWYGGAQYSGHTAKYEKNLILGGVNATIVVYSGNLTKDKSGKNTITYTPIDTENGFNVDNLYPGARQYFKITVENKTESDMAYSFFLNNIHFSKELLSYISIHTTAPTTKNKAFSEDDVADFYSGEKIISYFSLCDKYQLKKNEVLELYWYVEISEGAGNECSGKHIKIETISLGN